MPASRTLLLSILVLGLLAGTGLAHKDGPKHDHKAAPQAAKSPAAPAVDLPKAPLVPPVANEAVKNSGYVGSKACGDCHQKEYEQWAKSWHAKMLRPVKADIVVADFSQELTYADLEVVGADKQKVKISPTVKLSRQGDDFLMTLVDKDNEANNQTYKAAIVIGGNWEQQMEMQVGERLYPSPMRWVVADGQWRNKPFSDIWWMADGTPDGRPRKPEEMGVNQTTDAKCDGCHATGLTPKKEGEAWVLGSREGPGWSKMGIGCEKCHGPGAKHAELGTKDSILTIRKLNPAQQDQICGQCHSRVTSRPEKELAYPVGFIPGATDLPARVEFWAHTTQPGNFYPNEYASKNRQQFHDSRMSRHFDAGVTCVTCHHPHMDTAAPRGMRMAKDGSCRTCHAEVAALYEGSAHALKGVTCTDCHMARIGSRAGATRKNKEQWDVSSHAYLPVLPYEAETYKMRSSCEPCHAGEARTTAGKATMDARTRIEELTAKAQAVAASRKPGSPEAMKVMAAVNGLKVAGGGWPHNPAKAVKLLEAVK